MGSEPAWKPLASVASRSIPHRPGCKPVGLNRRAGSPEPAEDRERVLGQRLVDELAARLGLAVEPLGEVMRLLFGRSADKHVGVPTEDAVALVLEPAGQLFGLVWRARFDSHLPGCVPMLEDLLLGLELLGRLVVPAVFVGEPMLDRSDPCLGAGFAQLGIDDRAGSLGLC